LTFKGKSCNIEDGEFYIQTYETPEDDNSLTLDPDDGESKITFDEIKGGRLDGCYEVTLTGDTPNEVYSPSGPESAPCLDKTGKNIGEAYDYGVVKPEKKPTKKAKK
jgi:hypothetical protein